MKNLRRLFPSLVGLGLLLGLCAPALAQGQLGPANQIICNQLAQATLTGTGANVTTALVSAISGQSINICGWHVTESGTTQGTFQLEYGTQGGPCTTPTTMTPGFAVNNTAPATDHTDFSVLSTPRGVQLCVVTSGASTSTLEIGIWYSQPPLGG
jgi:hypothetical protein